MKTSPLTQWTLQRTIAQVVKTPTAEDLARYNQLQNQKPNFLAQHKTQIYFGTGVVCAVFAVMLFTVLARKPKRGGKKAKTSK